MMVRNWAMEAWDRYVGNASAVRDYRSQLRGMRPMWIWLSYLLVLVMVTMAYYAQIAGRRGSLSAMQMDLKTFYYTIMGLLGTVVVLAAPALTATSVTVERQRRSLDLIFSAPVSPRYFLVGKLLSSLRYTTMLIVLAIPAIAVCVVLGGATWTEVITAIAMLLMSSVCFSAIGILISSMCQSLVTATFVTILATGGYLMVVNLAQVYGITSLIGGFSGPMSASALPASPVSWIPGLSPFMSYMASPNALIFGIEMPSWIPALAWTLGFSRLMILGGESVLSEYRSKESRALRIFGLVWTAFLGFASGCLFSTMFGGAGSMNPGDQGKPQFALSQLFMFGFISILPMIASHSIRSEKKFRSSKAFALRETLQGTSDGVLPYLILLVSVYHGSRLLTYAAWPSPGFTSELFFVNELSPWLWSLSLVFFVWALCRLVSSLGWDLRWARTFAYGLLVAVFGIPLPILAAANNYASFPGALGLSPFFVWACNFDEQLIHSLALILLGATMAWLAERSYHMLKQRVGGFD